MFSSRLAVLVKAVGGGDVLQLKARPCRELAEEYLLESTKFWSGRPGGAEEVGGETERQRKDESQRREINERKLDCGQKVLFKSDLGGFYLAFLLLTML